LQIRSGTFIQLLVLVLFFSGCATQTQPPLAVKGVLDLTSWDFKKDGSITFNGEWEFYWRKLHSPDRFVSGKIPDSSGFIALPRTWNGFELKGETLGAEGFATFRLQVKLPSQCGIKAVRIPNQSSAYTLWINGEIVAKNGRVGTGRETEIPQYLLQESPISVQSRNLDVVLQVSNFSHRKGGVWHPIRLGTVQQIRDRHNYQWVLDLSLLGCFLIMALYHTGLFLLRRNDPSPILFAAITGFFAIRVLLTGNVYLTILFPDLPWEWQYTMELLSVTLAPPVFMLFFASLFPQLVWRTVLLPVCGVGGLFSLVAVFSPARISSHVVMPNQAVLLLALVTIIAVLVRAVRGKESGAGILLGGFGLLFLAIFHDILTANKVIYNIQVAPLGWFVLILSQSFVLSLRFSKAFKSIENLSGELEEKNIALSRLDRLKDEFLANTSHELKTPLNGIIGIAESVGAGAFGRLPEKVRENLSLIVSSGRRLSGLINDILDFSRLRNRDIQLNREAVDIRTLTDAVLAVSGPLVSGKDLTLKNEIPRGIPFVHGDEKRLQQILYNLVGNGIRFTPSGEVRVTASETDGVVEVAVADTGIGIESEHLDRIFDAFEQAEPAAGRSHGGMGLGLSITRRLVKLHGGGIRVESETDRGATFRFTLPVSHGIPETDPAAAATGVLKTTEEEPLPISPSDRPGQRDNPDRQSVLVVDDDPVNLQVVANHLSFLDVNVATCSGGGEALERIGSGELPDLILLDVMMPDMSGYEVCRKLRRQHAAAELPVIMLTVRSRVPDLVEGLSSGANDYLTKPFSKDELVARVETQLKLKRAYETFKENVRLKKELTLREKTEQDLKLMQRRLSEMLNSIDDAVIAVNASLEIGFCNRAFESLTGHVAGDLLGNSWEILFSGRETTKRVMADLMDTGLTPGESRNYRKLSLLRSDKGILRAGGLLVLLDVEEEPFHVFILRAAERDTPRGASTPGEALNRIRAHDGNRPGIDPSTILSPGEVSHRRKLGVRVMNLSVDAWIAATRTSKVELADRSGIWNVYIGKDGWARTQTLDRYLKEESLPANPRWLQIVGTADFVLAACDPPFPLKEKLETRLAELNALFIDG